MNISELTERNLLPIGRAYQQIANLMRAAAELRLHTDYKIEELLPLDHLGDGLAADSSRNHSFHVGDIDPIPRDLVAIDINKQAWLAEFAHYCQIREAVYAGEDVFNLYCLFLQHI